MEKREYSREEKLKFFSELLQLELARKLVANARLNKRIAQLEAVLNKLGAEKTPKGGKES